MSARFIAALSALSASLLLAGPSLRAAVQDAGAPAAPNAAPSAASSAAAAPSASTPDNANAENCIERIPAGKNRPQFSEKLASRAVSGHALTLEVTVEHGKGETVLPTGFHVLSDSPEAKALEREGFALPDPEGAAGPKLTRAELGERATTTVQISVVPLPAKPGRHQLILPPLPITVSRASGELVTVCTAPHAVTVEDPIANTPNPAPEGNPSARRQLEIWTAAKHAAAVALIALAVGALAALLISRWMRRPKKLPPPPPPRPPWDVALEALHDIRHAGLTREGRFAEVFDRVSDVLRRYLGDRYGYDGLESTTREALLSLRQTTPAIEDLPGIETFMRDADLVKFARLTPSEDECLDLMARAESIVTRTIVFAPVVAPLMTGAPPEGSEDSEDATEPTDRGRRAVTQPLNTGQPPIEPSLLAADARASKLPNAKGKSPGFDFRASAAKLRRALRGGLLVLYTLSALLVGLAYPALTRGDELLHAHWQTPWFLLALVLVPFVFYRATLGEDRRMPRLKLGTLAPLGFGPSGVRVWLRDLPGVVRAVGFALCVLALARPVNTLRPQSADEEGIDIVVVLDLSGSMNAAMANLPADLQTYVAPKPRGVRPTRIDAAKAVIRDFIARRKTDRIGIVVFGASAYVLSPPTLDYHLLDELVSKMELNVIDSTATAIGDAVGTAAARLRRSHARSKAIILLTDGDAKGGKISPEYSAHLANSVGARLYTIQIGQGDAAEVQDGFDLFGQPRYVSVPYPVNPKLLKELATKTGGSTYVATDAKALQASFHDVLDKLEKTKFEANIANYEDLFAFLLLPGVLLLACDAALRALVLRRFP